MQKEQLISGIEAKFEKSRLVFWYDPDHSFLENVSTVDIDGVTLLAMQERSVFETKKLIELDKPSEKFLLYFPSEKPEPEQDWLLDIGIYSEEFFADASSMLLNDLGIPKMSLRGHLFKHKSFFTSKQRLDSLKKFITENEDESSLDLKMIAVITKADSASITDILLKLVNAYASALSSGEEEIRLMTQLNKFELSHSFWEMVTRNFTYTADHLTLSDFVLKLFCTELWTQIDAEDKDWLLNNVFQSAAAKATALAFMKGWRDSKNFAESHDLISKVISKQLEVDTRCSHYEPLQLLECETFEAIEQNLIRGLVSSLLDTSKQLDRTEFDSILSKRLSGHWCSSIKEYQSAYEAIRSADSLLYLRQQHLDGFHYKSAAKMYDAYVEELYQFDQAYRLFNEHARVLFSQGSDFLRDLDEAIQNLYTNWYLNQLGIAWDDCLDKEKLLENWHLPEIDNQYQFYNKQVKKTLQQKQTKRIFVIISDAMRYEVAEELSKLINSEKRFKTKLDSQMGVLPSYTQLGMASLLPHSELSYLKEKGTAVFVDGVSSQGLSNRNKILSQFKGMAVSSKDIIKWSNQEGRDLVQDAEIVYIYHDTIDAIGDDGKTEDKTFEACRLAIVELNDLVTKVINKLNASRVIITADHGFLFRQKGLESQDKTKMEKAPTGAIEAKKRYIIGDNLASDDSRWKGKVSNTSNASCDTEFLLPKGAQRFHFVGGAKFVHGGAMLQEICVPIIEVSTLRGAKAAEHAQKPVGVVVASQPIKIVNNIEKLRFIQTEPVNKQATARLLDIVLKDSKGNEVSSRERVSFDSTSVSMDERTRSVRLKLIGSEFDRKSNYTLELISADTNTSYNQYAVTIDLAFKDDFF